MNYWNCISARLACNIQSFCSFIYMYCLRNWRASQSNVVQCNSNNNEKLNMSMKVFKCEWMIGTELWIPKRTRRKKYLQKYIIWNIFHSLGPSILNICLTDPFGMRFVGCHFQLDCSFWYNTNILAREYSGYFNNIQDKPETLHIFRWWHQQTDEHNMVCCWLMSLYSSVWMCVYCLFGSIRFGSVQWL